MTITQYNSNNSLTPEFKWAFLKKEIIWMNSITYRPRLKKNLWSKFRLWPKIKHQDRHNPESTGKIYSPIHDPQCFPNPRIRLIYSKNPQSARFLRPNPSIRKPIHPHPKARIIGARALKTLWRHLKVAPYSFLSAHALILKISWWRKLSNSTPKSRAGSRSKMLTYMASKLLKFVYRKCCVDRFRFQNICRLNRRPQLSLLDVKEKYTTHAGVSTNEADFMWFARSPRSSSEAKQDGLLPHIFAVLGGVCGLDTKPKI